MDLKEGGKFGVVLICLVLVSNILCTVIGLSLMSLITSGGGWTTVALGLLCRHHIGLSNTHLIIIFNI